MRAYYIGYLWGFIELTTYYVYSRGPTMSAWNYHFPIRPIFGADNTSRSTTNLKDFVGVIWPRRTNETNDRIVEQIDFIKAFTTVNQSHRPTKVILRVGDFNFYDYKEGQGHFVEDGCPVNWCTITTNTRVRSWADALLITEFGWKTLEIYLPKPAHQIWIARHHESPKMNRINPNVMKDLVNWTSSYRRDSTIATGFYGRYAKTVNVTSLVEDNYAAGKTRKVAWLVSNCHPYNNRWTYVQELAKYINVDIFGDCGKMRAEFKDVNKEYKFYLAFENAHCKDYITEKLLEKGLGYLKHSKLFANVSHSLYLLFS